MRATKICEDTMEKIAEGYYRFTEQVFPSEDVSMALQVNRIDGEDLDTQVRLVGNFTISGQSRREFAQKLGALIDEYRI